MSEDRVQTSDRQDRPSGEQRQGGSRRPDRNKSRGKRSRSRGRDDRRPQGKGSGQGQGRGKGQGQGQDRQSAKRRPAPRNPESKQRNAEFRQRDAESRPRDAESRQRVAETKKRETDSKPRETQDKSQAAGQQQRNVRDGAGENQPRRNKRRRLQQRNKKPAQELEVQVKLETFEDYRRENERLEKEIWLEIASIRTISLD